jgi:hypothetical protein
MEVRLTEQCRSSRLLPQYGNENDRDDSWRGVQLLGDGSWQIAVKDGSETVMCLDW